MKTSSLGLGIELCPSGIRIAVMNTSGVLLHSEGVTCPERVETLGAYLTKLIRTIPKELKPYLKACAVNDTSEVLIACNQKGEPLGNSLKGLSWSPNNEEPINQSLLEASRTSKMAFAVNSACYLVNIYGSNILLRYESDWVTGWLTGEWKWGEESNQIRLGWNPKKRSWPSIYEKLQFEQALPLVVESGKILSTIDPSLARILQIPNELKIISGTSAAKATILASDQKKDCGVTFLGNRLVITKLIQHADKGIDDEGYSLENFFYYEASSSVATSLLKNVFMQENLRELSRQINPELESGLILKEISLGGQQFSIIDKNLKEVIVTRPISDSLYIHAIFENIARVEKQVWQKLVLKGIPSPKHIISIGYEAINPQLRKIRERVTGLQIKSARTLPAKGLAQLALNAISKTKKKWLSKKNISH